jgi:hypothetical protein
MHLKRHAACNTELLVMSIAPIKNGIKWASDQAQLHLSMVEPAQFMLLRKKGQSCHKQFLHVLSTLISAPPEAWQGLAWGCVCDVHMSVLVL